MSTFQEVRTTETEPGRGQRFATFKATQLIWLLLGLVEAGIALRVVFKLVGVNASNAFATFLYNTTGIFVAPFASLTGAPASNGMVLEISSIIAMLVYLLIAWGLERIVYVVFYRPRGPVSVSQTTLSEHSPLPTPRGSSQTVTTDRTTTSAPFTASQTTVTKQAQTPPPGPFLP